MTATASLKRAEDLVGYINASPTPFHAVQAAKQRLEKAGFRPIKEREAWSAHLQPGGKYYVTRNGSTFAAFAVGQKWQAGNPISMVGAHTDSPCLRVKPVSRRSAEGFLQVGVECYGGGMWHTWYDRDLSVAGRVMVKSAAGSIEMRLVRIRRPILRIPNLAVHFGVAFEVSKENNLFPITGLVSAELNRTGQTAEATRKAESEAEEKAGFQPLKTVVQRHHPYLISLLAEDAGCKPEDIEDFEIVLYDTQPSCIGGLNNELIYSPRLDNLGMTYCAIEGLIQSLETKSALINDPTIRLIACFDHEEVGSMSAQGADSNFLPSIIKRLSTLDLSASANGSDGSYERIGGTDTSSAYEQTLATSFLISADMAHSIHPNFSSQYEAEHKPHMNEGTVVKVNANVRYATNSPGIVLLQECARRAKASSYQPPGAKTAQNGGFGVPLQLIVQRNDARCGTTIGPMLAASLGARTIDVGNPMLAMHSIRETSGCYDVEYGVNLFDAFFEHYGELESKVLVD